MAFQETARAAPAIAGSDPRERSCLGSIDGSQIPTNPAKSQEAIAALLGRDFAAEAFRVVAIKAAHAADDVSLGDDHGAEREIRLAISHLRAGAATFRELQNSLGGCLRVITGENGR